MADQEDKGLFGLGGIMKKAQEAAQNSMPHCEAPGCGGTLMGGSMTVLHNGKPMIICMKCVLAGTEYYLTKRDEGLRQITKKE